MKLFLHALVTVIGLGVLMQAVEANTTRAELGYVHMDKDPIVIKNGPGGRVLQHVVTRAELAKSGKQVRIEGWCASACTIFYSLPNACMAKGSSLAFHGVQGPFGLFNGSLERKMAQFYRGGVKDKWMNEWRNIGKGKPLHKVPRSEVRKLDPQVKFCEE